MRRSHRAVVPCLVLLAVACRTGGPEGGPEQQDIEHAKALAGEDPPLRTWVTDGPARPVVLYVDRSGSMRGFLDPGYAATERTDFRLVLDGIEARIRPARVYGYGNEISEVSGAGLGVLGDKAFYDDGNTEMEEVFPLVAGDSALASSHLVIGDGRRGNPNAANEQFVRMRRLALDWVTRGGTFAVGVSKAPFKPVANDPAGCTSPEGRCPLYVFAFLAPGDEHRVTAALADVFQSLYVTPLPALGPEDARLEGQAAAGITLESGWARRADGAPIARLRGTAQTNQPLSARLVVRDTTSPRGRVAAAVLRGRTLLPSLATRGVAPPAQAGAWRPAQAGALARATDDPFRYGFISRGPQAERYLYRIELRAAGAPAWLREYDAENAADGLRTFGLGRLFEGFAAADPAASPPVLRAYAVVN